MLNKNLTQHLKAPKNIFLINGLGALLSASLLFGVLRNFDEYIGLPKTIFIYLALIATVFCVYSFTCFLKLKNSWQPYLTFIAIANLLYIFLTIILIFLYITQITFWGLSYFLLELLIIGVIIFGEFKIIKTSK